MGIYPARPQLTSTEKQILRVIAEALVDMPESRQGSNVAASRVPLSDSDATELLELLEDYVSSKKFRDRAEFVEEIGSAGASKTARELYLRGRTQSGRTRVAATWQWGSFQLRLGIGRDIAPGSKGAKMDFGRFLTMEERLLLELRLHPRLVSLVLQLVADQRRNIEGVRNGRLKLTHGSVRSVPESIIQELKAAKKGDSDHTIPLRKVVALTTLTADLAVMFTTRDWGVAGTLSAMAAVPPALFT